MSGNYSRRKGLTNEYKVRDLLRGEGFKADRVPSSGAAEGFKGDIKIERDGVTHLVEVKVRSGHTFKRIYELYERLKDAEGRAAVCIPTPGHLLCVDISDKLLPLVTTNSLMYPPADEKTGNIVLKMRKWLGEAHFLAIRNDHKSFLFLRYR